ncbi:MAG: HAMP domain-containing sensor histidine kinase [Candidatus Saccharimonadales bacterium]
MKLSFHSATLRLSAWYTLILLVVSLLFSTIVFEVSSHELRRGFGPNHPVETPLFIDSPMADDWREARINQGRARLLAQLALFNTAVLLLGAGGSYLLAKRTLQPIEQAMESQARFSSDAAHELRTPLTIMQSELEVGLRDKKATLQSKNALLKSTLDEVHHMRTLTDRLLALASSKHLALAPCQLEEVAIDAVNRCIPLAQSKKIAIHNTIAPHIVTADKESLTDALVILLENAVKYSPPKSTVTLHAVAKNKTIEIQVIDEGPGVHPQDLPHIFDRFYRADTSRSSQNVAGHGLGLSIAERISQAHHGELTAKNNPTKGATFTLALPLA